MAATVGFTSCDDYLDKLPDNRMELSSPSDVSKLLVNAYSETNPAYLLEMYSDNTTEYYNNAWTAESRFQDQAYAWADITETGNESVNLIWDSYYSAIRTANEAIAFIEKQKNQDEYKAQLGEAYVCRAYAEFILSTVFCRAYNPQTADKELGLPYPTAPDYKLLVEYDRGTLAQLYDNIDKDLKRGIPLLTNTYEHPKFHFTPAAANAFAARFYLYYQKYDDAIRHATAALGSNPATKLRDWASWYGLSMNYQVQPNAYISSTNPANLLLQVTYSMWGIYGGPYGAAEKYAHGARVSKNETLQAEGPWGETETAMAGEENSAVFYTNGLSKYILRKIPFLAEVTDVSSGTGYAHSEFSVLNTDETLVVRAEAYALKGEYEKALADINTELSKFMPYMSAPLTIEGIKEFYNGTKRPNGAYVGGLDYYTPEYPTVKHELHPMGFTLEEETQDPMIQCILQLRRLLTIHEGLRMQDVKRYGITIYRMKLNESDELIEVTDKMTADDPRSAVQLPVEVLSAGMQPNPRNTNK